MFFLFRLTKIYSAGIDQSFDETIHISGRNTEELRENQASTSKSAEKMQTQETEVSSTVPKWTESLEKLATQPKIQNCDGIDSNYMVRSLLDCFFNSDHFAADLFQMHNSENMLLLGKIYFLSAFSRENTADLWKDFWKILRLKNLIHSYPFANTISDFAECFCMFMKCESQKLNFSNLSFLTESNFFTVFCRACKTYSAVETEIVIFLTVLGKSTDLMMKSFSDLLKPMVTSGFDQRSGVACTCSKETRENQQNTFTRTCSSKLPKCMMLIFKDSADMAQFSDESLPKHLESPEIGKYDLLSFIIYDGEYSSVILSEEKWILSNTKGEWDVSMRIEELLSGRIELAFYEKDEKS